MTSQQKVDNGIKLLEENGYENWAESINIDTLDMCYNCILDQVCGNYEQACDKLGIKTESEKHGFTGCQNEWIKRIKEKRGY